MDMLAQRQQHPVKAQEYHTDEETCRPVANGPVPEEAQGLPLCDHVALPAADQKTDDHDGNGKSPKAPLARVGQARLPLRRVEEVVGTGREYLRQLQQGIKIRVGFPALPAGDGLPGDGERLCQSFLREPGPLPQPLQIPAEIRHQSCPPFDFLPPTLPHSPSADKQSSFAPCKTALRAAGGGSEFAFV